MKLVTELTKKLINIESITPNDNGCQKLLSNMLEQAGFNIEHKRFGNVDNLFAWHGSKNGKSLMFLGHTDVVPTGDVNLWKHLPFAAKIDGDMLFGRGAADMKGGVAAFTLAIIDYVKTNPDHKGKISLMLTSDEEGEAKDGIKKMMPHIVDKHNFDYCIVGEPSSKNILGDVVRIGRRGSLHVEIIIHGKQGHVAYPQNANNPIFLAASCIDDLSKYSWDNSTSDFPETSFQISSVKTSSNTSNIIPADLIIQANFRFNPESNKESLENSLISILNQHQLQYSLAWNLSGNPFHSKSDLLKLAISSSINDVLAINPEFNTAGGTSDGRFVAPFGVDVAELGVINKTIHQIDECVLITDLNKIQKVYSQIIEKLIS